MFRPGLPSSTPPLPLLFSHLLRPPVGKPTFSRTPYDIFSIGQPLFVLFRLDSLYLSKSLPFQVAYRVPREEPKFSSVLLTYNTFKSAKDVPPFQTLAPVLDRCRTSW